MGLNQFERANERRDLDVSDTQHTVIVDNDGDIIDIYTVDDKTFLGVRAAGQEDGFAVHVNDHAARAIIQSLMMRVLDKQ